MIDHAGGWCCIRLAQVSSHVANGKQAGTGHRAVARVIDHVVNSAGFEPAVELYAVEHDRLVVFRIAVIGWNETPLFARNRSIARTGDWVYWVDGGFKRLRHDAETEPVDYAIGRWEVTQGVQDGSHTVPIAALKPIFVRVYANEIQGSAGDNVRAQLRGYINGVELPGSPILPIANNNLDLQADLPLRADPDRTYIFSLPFDWTASEGVELQAEINPNHLVFESDYGNNLYPPPGPRKFPMTAPFICLVTFPVAATTPEGATVIFDNDPAVYDPRMDRARTLLPMWLNVVKDSTVVWKEQGDGDPVPHTLPDDPSEVQLLAAIGETGELSDPPQGCLQAATRYGGIVDQSADFVPNFGGRATGNRFWARWWDGESQFEYILPAGGFLWAHETGHTLGSPHVDCGRCR